MRRTNNKINAYLNVLGHYYSSFANFLLEPHVYASYQSDQNEKIENEN